MSLSSHTFRILICTLFAAVFLHGCTSSEDQTNITTTGTPVVVPEATEKATSSHRHIIEIKAMKFHPASIAVEKGDTVVWVNHGFTIHDITALPDSAWTSGQMPAGKSWSLTVDQSTEYFCSLHKIMKGSILVK